MLVKVESTTTAKPGVPAALPGYFTQANVDELYENIRKPSHSTLTAISTSEIDILVVSELNLTCPLPQVSGRASFVCFLPGYEVIRQRGSHSVRKISALGEHNLTVPDHAYCKGT